MAAAWTGEGEWAVAAAWAVEAAAAAEASEVVACRVLGGFGRREIRNLVVGQLRPHYIPRLWVESGKHRHTLNKSRVRIEALPCGGLYSLHRN